MNELTFISIGFDEDGRYVVDKGLLDNFEYKDYIVEGAMSNFVSKEEAIKEINEFISDDNDWFSNDGIEEVNKFKKELVNFINCMDNGLILSWAVEYDMNWMIIFGDKEEIINWFNREIEYDD